MVLYQLLNSASISGGTSIRPIWAGHVALGHLWGHGRRMDQGVHIADKSGANGGG